MAFRITYQDAAGAHGGMAHTYRTLVLAEEIAADLMVRLTDLARTDNLPAANIAVDIHDEHGGSLTYTIESDLRAPLARFMEKEGMA